MTKDVDLDLKGLEARVTAFFASNPDSQASIDTLKAEAERLQRMPKLQRFMELYRGIPLDLEGPITGRLPSGVVVDELEQVQKEGKE